MEATLASQLQADKAELLELFDRIAADKWETETQPGKWTFRQLSEHIFRTNAAILNLLVGQKGEPKAEGESKVSFMEKIFINDEQSYPAPPVVAPQAVSIPMDELRNSLDQTYNALSAQAGKPDLDRQCTGFNHPNFGTLTGTEWLEFIRFHNRRHFRQLERAL